MNSLPNFAESRVMRLPDGTSRAMLMVLGYPSDRTCWRIYFRGHISIQRGKRKAKSWDGQAEVVGYELAPDEPLPDRPWQLASTNDPTAQQIICPIRTRVWVRPPLFLEQNHPADGEPYETLCGLEHLRSKAEMDRHLRELWQALSLIRDIEARGRPVESELDPSEAMILAEAERTKSEEFAASGKRLTIPELERRLNLEPDRLKYLRRKQRDLSR